MIGFAFLAFMLFTSNGLFARPGPRRRLKARSSTRCCRIPASRCIRRCSISAMSGLSMTLLLRGRRHDRRPGRCGLGALGAALDALLAWTTLGTAGIVLGSHWA